MISHDNLIFDTSVTLSQMPLARGRAEERSVSYLPLSHVAAMLLDVILPIFISANTESFMSVSFARPYDLKLSLIGNRLRSVKPTLFFGVPRVWEKISDKIRAAGRQSTGCKKNIAIWSKKKGLEHAENCMVGGNGQKGCCYCLAEKLVFNKVLRLLGLDECKLGATGAAPIAVDTLKFFGSLGLQINEMYGMSESCGMTTVSTDTTHHWGSCGYAPPGIEIKIFKRSEEKGNEKIECEHAQDFENIPDEAQGEICFRGRHIMLGYLANPELGEEHVAQIIAKNKEAIDSDGWLHSGDKGCKDKNGMIKITGRFKELIIGAGGENVAPVPIEDNIKVLCPAISNIIMFGNKRKFNVCLVTLKSTETGGGENPGSDFLEGDALLVNSNVTTISVAIKDETWIEYITNGIKETNKNGEICPSGAARIQKFSILPCDLSISTGELTPTLKAKRSVVEKKFQTLIDSMYKEENIKNLYIPYQEYSV